MSFAEYDILRQTWNDIERSYRIHTTRKKRRFGCGDITRGGRKTYLCILAAYQEAFEKLGFFLARRPLVVLLMSLIFVIGSCLGFIRLRIEKPTVERFTVTDSQSRKDLHDAAQFFPILEARQEEIIMTPKHGENILSGECLKDALNVHQAITTIGGYTEICLKQQFPNISPKSGKQRCRISSPLELAGTQFQNLNNLSSILARELTNPTVVLSSGDTFNSSYKQMLANFQVERNANPLTTRADALRVIYFIRKTTNKEDEQSIEKFEASLESVLSSKSSRLKCAELCFKTGKARNDALQNVLKPEVWPLCISTFALIVLVIIVMFLSSTNLDCLSILFLIFSCILLPMACSTGIISMSNSALFPATMFLPFLLLGKASSDIILLLNEWERQRSVQSIEHRAVTCVSRAGFLAVWSPLCGTILSGIAISSSFDVISDYFLATLIANVAVSVTSLIGTLLFLMYLKKGFENFLSRLCTSTKLESGNLGLLQYQKDKLRSIIKVFPRMTTSFGGKILGLVMFVCILSLCVFSALKQDERTTTTESLNQDVNYKKFNKAKNSYFGDQIDTSIFFSEDIDYSQPTVQNQISNICTKLQEASYSKGESYCWMAAFHQWSLHQKRSCTYSGFYQCLEHFLNQSQNAPFRQDVRLETRNSRLKVLASRIHINFESHNQFRKDRRSMENLRAQLQGQFSLKALAVSEKFFDLDDLFRLEKEAVSIILIVATAVVFVFSLISTLHLGISFFLAVTFDFMVLEVVAIMEASEIHLNHISFLSVYTSIILALNFSFQMAHSFLLSTKQGSRARMNDALSSPGWSVLTGASVMIFGAVSLGFIYPNMADIFHRLLPLVFFVGLMHALVIFPAIMLSFIDFVHFVDSRNDMDMVPVYKKQTNKVTLEVRDDNRRQAQPKRPGISIVGISCRFPGARSKDKFWDLLEQGKSSISAFPENRSEQHKAFFEIYNPKRFVSRRHCAVTGSYLEDITQFDNNFFGISDQEARAMDPQQRILLQVVYEAIDDAGMQLEELQKCRTGVFVGLMNQDYMNLLGHPSNRHNLDQFASTGNAWSILANRVSFCLNLTGPSMVIDTACSSSLTALKLGCDSLHQEDCEIAIVCASNIILDHIKQMTSSLAGLLAPDGRCKSFNASADGYGRGEGIAAVILKMSNAALSDKDDTYCEIIACGVNSDGKNAVPMTAPSATMQSKLSRRVLAQSGVAPEDVDYIEMHGTGTAIGDVVEATSIADIYTRQIATTTRKLRIGSVKSNLNHTESTSGLAGLIKVALMIKNKTFVPTVNVHVLNPKLKLEENNLFVQQSTEPWTKEEGKPRIAAMNSFGFGGSNVHAVLREVTSKQILQVGNIGNLNNVLTLSARSEEALRKMARLYSEWIKNNAENMDKPFMQNLCYSLNERRSQLPHRIAFAFSSTDEASQYLADYANDSVGWDKLISYAEVKATKGKLVFMFGGQGSQWYAMGRQLIEIEDAFREAVLMVSNCLKDCGAQWSLIDELMAAEDDSRINENYISQPATFAIQYATAQLLMSWKIYPSAIIGHSLGEFAAACIAGIITVKEAVRLVLARSTLQDKCPNNGGMAALGMSEEKARALLRDLKLGPTLDIAAINDANSVTVAGESQSIEALGQHLAMNANDTFWRVLGTKRAFHSCHMEPIKKPFHAALRRINLNPQLSKIPVYSTVEGEVLSGQQFNGDYWWRNIRRPVQFYPAMRKLLRNGYNQIIEISSQPILAHYVKQIALQENLKDQEIPVVFATLPRKRVPVKDQHRCFLQNTVCKLYTLGFAIDWTCVLKNPSAKFVRSLNSPWLEKSFWYRESPPDTIIHPLGSSKTTQMPPHPFLAEVKLTDPYSGLQCWETEIDLHRFPALRDHALIQGGAVMPGAAYLEMAFAMVKHKFPDAAGLELRDVKLSSLLILPETQVRSLRLRLQKSQRIDEAKFIITSVQDDQSEINLSSGNISVDLLDRNETFEDAALGSIEAGFTVHELMADMETMPMERFRPITEKFGFNYGPTFSIIKQIWQRNNEVLSLVDISESSIIQTEAKCYVVHPSILDACLQSCLVPLANLVASGTSIVPVGFQTITLNDAPSTNQLYCHATINNLGGCHITLMCPSGKVSLMINGFRYAELNNTERQFVFDELAYEVQWMEDALCERRDSAPQCTCIVLKESSGFSDALVTRLQAAKVNTITVGPPNPESFNGKVEEAIKAAISDIPVSKSSNLRIVNLWPLETTLLPEDFRVIDQAQSIALSSSVFVVKLLLEKSSHESRLFLVTERTQFLDASGQSMKMNCFPWSSTVWGLRRTAVLEESSVKITAVDLQSKGDMHEVDFLIDEILGDSSEGEVAFRDGKRFMNRIVRSKLSPEQPTVNRIHSKKRSLFYLSSNPSSGMICLRESTISKPSHSEVTIKVLHCWIPSETLIDVVKPNGCVFVLGKVIDLPGKSEHTFQMGEEVCGVISSGRVSSTVTIQESNLFIKPESLSEEQATCIPASLAIASHALQKVASGEQKQKLLIHEANRGPGIAAVVLARTLGHKVFCTIPDTSKTDTKSTLLELGAERVARQSFSGLDDDFSHSFDAVLFFHQPSPNALQNSARSLKRGGRVIILSSEFNGDVILTAKANVRYEREDVGDILRSPQAYRKLSLESLELLKGKGILEKLLGIQLVSTDLATAVEAVNASLTNKEAPKHQMEAFSSISFSIYTFTFSETDSGFHNLPILARGVDACGLRENRTYLVAGGMRGFGFEVARWMVENGAKSIGLISRSKPSDAKCEEIRQLERRTGSKIHMFQIDISHQDQMSAFSKHLESLPSVAGIFNTAMVLKDQFVRDWTFQSFSEVMAPKIKGSFLLHQMSLEMDLDFFVMFSSMASILGNKGQPSYSACNAFQDSLAQYRRHVLGVPGLAINWGPISGAGVLERESRVASLLSTAGWVSIHAKDGVKYMARILTEEPSRSQIALIGANWPQCFKSDRELRKKPRLAVITAENDAYDNQPNSAKSLVQRIRLEKDSEQKSEQVMNYISNSVRKLTGIASLSEADLNKSLYSYGFDSTGALSLKMQFEADLQVSFEVFYFMQPDTTLLKLTRDVTAKLNGQSSSEKPQATQSQDDGPTQEQAIAEASSSTTQQNQVQVVPLYTPDSSAINFFCVHPSHRYALNLVPISTGFQGQDMVSFYALGFTDPTAVSEDWGGVRKLAVHYVQLIMNQQPHGPYFLGGYSYGGLLAYEMASLLTEQNQRVEFLAMIDTFPWIMRSSTISTRIATTQEGENSPREHVQLQFENYLGKLAVDTLKMTADEYKHLREKQTQDDVMDELQRRSLEKGVASYNLRALREALFINQSVSTRTHYEWQPSEVRYRGPLTYVKSQNNRFFPRTRASIEEIWGHLVDGGITVLVCPGDHYSLSELPQAQVTGGILATALVFRYRMLFPELPKPKRTFCQRRAVEKLCNGVNVFLHSKRGNKTPHFGKLIFLKDANKLELRSSVDKEDTDEDEKAKKIINLKDLRMVQPGRVVSSAKKYAWRKRRVGAHESGNLGQIASVVTGRRVYNLEFTDYSDLKTFYDMVEAVFAVTLLTS